MVRTLVPLTQIADSAIDALLDRAFGSDRRSLTAYRLREGLRPIGSLSYAVIDEHEQPIGSIQAWPVALAHDDGRITLMVMVGPVAVDPTIQRNGLGRMLTSHLLAAVTTNQDPGAGALMLVGDPEYYGRFFGFSAERTSRWRLPGPFDPRRLLARGPDVPARAGMVVPRG